VRACALTRILVGIHATTTTPTRRRGRLPAAACCLLAALGVAGCGLIGGQSSQSATQVGSRASVSPSASPRPSPRPSPTPSPSPTCTGIAPGFSCEMQDRISAAQSYLAGTPGSIGIVLEDRATGAVWRNVNAAAEYPAASTMKLAMMTDILLRAHAGQIDLTSADQDEMYQALYTSDDDDANDLWDKYEDGSFLTRIRAFGMTGAEFTASPPNWGYMYCTAEDLDNLMNYVLNDAPASVRDYLVDRLQHVSSVDQQWGVWGAGAENQPGNKDGWEWDPPDLWITNTVGFAGPDQRYTLAIMYNLEGYDGSSSPTGFDYGINKLSQIASLLFQGHSTSQPTALPSAVP
jgi:hypothetical protein